MEVNHDKIVYLRVSMPGGEDGMSTDKGGKILDASYHKQSIQDKIGKDSRYRMDKIIVDTEERRKVALKKLDKVDLLVLNLTGK
jgi:transposase